MDAIRILVVGDAHVGKTTLIDVLCGEYDDIDTEKTRRRLTSGVENSTVGCYINIREHEMSRQHRQHNSATPVLPKTHIASHHRRNNNSNSNSNLLPSNTTTTSSTAPAATSGVEFVEVGGSRQYALSRSALYSNVHAIILVHDLTSPQTLYSLSSTWLKELTIADQKHIHHGGISARHQLGGDDDPEDLTAATATASGGALLLHQERLTSSDLSAAQSSLLQRIPVLVVGNKLRSASSSSSGALRWTTAKYEEEVRTVVFSTVGGSPRSSGNSSSSNHCVVIDAYGEAEEATSYRNGGSRMEHILRFVDTVCAATAGCETA